MAARDSSDLDSREEDAFFFGDADVDDVAALEQKRDARPSGHRATPKPARERFQQWRNQRPFVPGLLLILSGVVMLAPAYFTIRVSDLLVMIATISGVSTLLVGATLIMFGIGMWLQPHAAPYLGVLGILVAIIALPTSNIGGFLVGSLLGILGGALGLAWENGEGKPGAKHARGKNQLPAPTASDGDGKAKRDNAYPDERGGSTKIDLSALHGPTSVAVVLSAFGLVLANSGDEPAVQAQESDAQQQLTVPSPPSIPLLPNLSAPPLGGDLQLPAVPTVPSLPAVPSLSQPPTALHIPPVPADVVAYPELTPTRTIAPQNLSTVTADQVTITGNVRATMGMVTIGDEPTRTLILTGDSLTARNLSLEVPGFASRGMLTTGQVETKVYDGPVTVVATGLSATPVVAGVPTLPVTVDLRGSLGDILAQLGVPDAHPVPNVPVPNFVMDRIALGGVTMHMVSLDGLHLHAPAVQLRVPK